MIWQSSAIFLRWSLKVGEVSEETLNGIIIQSAKASPEKFLLLLIRFSFVKTLKSLTYLNANLYLVKRKSSNGNLHVLTYFCIWMCTFVYGCVFYFCIWMSIFLLYMDVYFIFVYGCVFHFCIWMCILFLYMDVYFIFVYGCAFFRKTFCFMDYIVFSLRNEGMLLKQH